MLDSRPELLCRRQSGLYEPLETAEFKGSPLFWATQAIESEISWSRSFSFNPSASRGGRPSSVSALPDFQALSAHRLGLLIDNFVVCRPRTSWTRHWIVFRVILLLSRSEKKHGTNALVPCESVRMSRCLVYGASRARSAKLRSI
jgi:hypothetical protein